jgi:hypothetical protein
MAKPVDESKLIEGLVHAKNNESKFVEAAASAFRAQVERHMSRARAMAMMSGGYQVRLTLALDFNFEPKKEEAKVTCTGQIAAFETSQATAVN